MGRKIITWINRPQCVFVQTLVRGAHIMLRSKFCFCDPSLAPSLSTSDGNPAPASQHGTRCSEHGQRPYEFVHQIGRTPFICEFRIEFLLWISSIWSLSSKLSQPLCHFLDRPAHLRNYCYADRILETRLDKGHFFGIFLRSCGIRLPGYDANLSETAHALARPWVRI